MDKKIERERVAGAGWLAVSVVALLAAGVFALLPVVARVPLLQDLFSDPLLARRCLVVHVTLALQAWFLGFLGLLAERAATRREGAPGDALLNAAPPQGVTHGDAGPVLAASGVTALIASGFLPGAQPVLANYIPVLDHPLFLAGLLVVFAGAGMALLPALRGLAWMPALAGTMPADDPGVRMVDAGKTRFHDALPPSAHPFVGAAAFAVFAALLTLGVTALRTPAGWQPSAYYEELFWGPGHIFQFAHVAGMLAAWLALAAARLGRDPLAPRAARGLALLLVAPTLAGPVLAAMGPGNPLSHRGFTLLMQWGLFPVTLLVLGAIVHASVRTRRARASAGQSPWTRDPASVGLVASVSLALTGFLLGAAIRGSSTLVPAHYHAAIGAVTAAYMALTWRLLPSLGFRMPSVRIARIQPVLFAVGQLLFALGFGYAGLHGMARKVYGAEQHVRTAAEWAGLTVMGLGGLVAVAGGILFLAHLLSLAGFRLLRPLAIPLPFISTPLSRRNA